MSAIDEVAKEIFRPQNSTLLPVTDDGTESIGPGLRTRSEGIPRHRLYDTERLKLTLLDKRSPQALAKPLLRAYARLITVDSVKVPTRTRKPRTTANPTRPNLPDWRQQIRQAALKYDIVDEEDASAMPQLRVTLILLVLLRIRGYEQLGTELSLFPSPLYAEALLLHDEAAITFGALAAINPALAYPTGKINPQVAVVRMPSNATLEQKFDYHVEVGKLLPVDLNLGVPLPAIT